MSAGADHQPGRNIIIDAPAVIDPLHMPERLCGDQPGLAALQQIAETADRLQHPTPGIIIEIDSKFLHHGGRDPSGADFLAGKFSLVQDRNAQSGVAQRPCEGGTCGPAANDEDIKHRRCLRARDPA